MTRIKSQIPLDAIHLGSMTRHALQKIKNTVWQKHRIRITNAQAIELALGEYFGAIIPEYLGGSLLGKFAIFIHPENPRAIQVGNTQMISAMHAHTEAVKADKPQTEAVKPQAEPPSGGIQPCGCGMFSMN